MGKAARIGHSVKNPKLVPIHPGTLIPRLSSLRDDMAVLQWEHGLPGTPGAVTFTEPSSFLVRLGATR
jgi:hypothetical protein